MFTLFGSRHRQQEVIQHSTIFLLIFFFTLHLTPSFYVNSSFLSTFFSERNVGLLYTAASFSAIIVILLTRKLLPRFGNYRLFMGILFVEVIALIGLVFSPSASVVAISFILNFVSTALAFMHADIFLESSSQDTDTGTTRGFLLTCQNMSFVLGPIIASLLIGTDDYWKVYVLGLIILIPVILFSSRTLQGFKDPHYRHESFFSQAKTIIKDRDVFFALLCAFMLRVFYAWMVIYSPLFLHNHLGFDWQQIGLIIGIGLIPFVLLEYALGRLADKRFGEKEMLSIGFIIMSVSTAAFVFAPQIPSLVLWASIIFCTRIGASIVEVMTETYLFKKIDVTDINTISFFRILQPMAYVVSPIVASVALFVFDDIKYLFLILSIYLLFGLRYSLALNDTE